MKRLTFIWVHFLIGLSLFGFEPLTDSNFLFKIGRSRDANEIYYTLKLDDNGRLDPKNPISIYWIKRSDGNKTEPLTWIQNKYAYGLNFSSVTDSESEFQFVSYKKMTFHLKKNEDGLFKVFTFAGDKEIELNSIFIQIDGGSFWLPTISRVELHATIPECRTEIAEIIIPK